MSDLVGNPKDRFSHNKAQFVSSTAKMFSYEHENILFSWLPAILQVGKKTKKVGFVEERQPQPQLGLDFLSFILQHHHTQDAVLRDNIKECVAIRDLLRGCKVGVIHVLCLNT